MCEYVHVCTCMCTCRGGADLESGVYACVNMCMCAHVCVHVTCIFSIIKLR
jgi:hypothetical protein